MESNLAVIRASETALKSLNEEYNMGTKTIIDIVEEEVGVQRKTNRSGLLGSIIVQNRVTDLLDLEGIVQLAESSFLVKSKTTSLPDKA